MANPKPQFIAQLSPEAINRVTAVVTRVIHEDWIANKPRDLKEVVNEVFKDAPLDYINTHGLIGPDDFVDLVASYYNLLAGVDVYVDITQAPTTSAHGPH